jgi:phosphoglycolate phosphatase-like HAD superfamily hydrolase
MKAKAIAFDFDGTLVGSGSDKCVHVMYAAYVACAATGFRRFLDPRDPGRDVERLVRGVLPYPGAPRFQQLAALVNALIHDRPIVVEAPAGLDIEPALAAEYEGLRNTFNSAYSALNAAAATTYWKAYPTALAALPRLAQDFDLYVASGVPQDLLEADLIRHGYDPCHFRGVWGADRQGGGDKAELLGRIRSLGYLDVLFVGDATRDLEYAQAADVKFFRVEGADDFLRLEAMVWQGFPDRPNPWAWTDTELEFFRAKTLHLIEALLAGRPLSPVEAVDAIHS